MSTYFVSYVRGDSSFLRLLRKKLEGNRHRVWVDNQTLLGGANWREAIDAAIRRSDAVLLMWSRKSSHSEYVNYEWAFALGAGIPVIPLLLDRIETPDRLLPLQHIDARRKNHRRWLEIMTSVRASRSRRSSRSG